MTWNPERGQGVDLVAPHPARVRESVEQHDGPAARR